MGHEINLNQLKSHLTRFIIHFHLGLVRTLAWRTVQKAKSAKQRWMNGYNEKPPHCIGSSMAYIFHYLSDFESDRVSRSVWTFPKTHFSGIFCGLLISWPWISNDWIRNRRQWDLIIHLKEFCYVNLNVCNKGHESVNVNIVVIDYYTW